MKYYVLLVEEDLYPSLRGPFDSEDVRDEHAKAVKADDEEQENGIYWLNVDDAGALTVGDYTGGFLTGELDWRFRHPSLRFS